MVKPLTFPLVAVVLAKVRNFKLVIGCSHLCFLAWLNRSRSIVRSTALGVVFSLFGGFVIGYNELKNDLIWGDKSLALEVLMANLGFQPSCFHFC